jgi:tRNA pseudouridine55 synthase
VSDAPSSRTPSGLLNLNKPPGMTSRDVVNLVARPLRKIKVGHAGTLDPLATGVLVLCVGSATRLIEFVQRMPKSYRARIRLGASSDTDDADGTITEAEDPPIPSIQRIREALTLQVGVIDQVPPGYSAIKVAGQRSYDLARAGRAVELKARPVTISRIELLSFDWPHLEVEVDCGSGTYIRSIARDLGQVLGSGGFIEVLTRTRIGHFSIEDALDPRVLDRASILESLRPPAEAVGYLPRVSIDGEQARALVQGRPISVEDAIRPGEVAAIATGGVLLAIVESVGDGRTLIPRRVLETAPDDPEVPHIG